MKTIRSDLSRLKLVLLCTLAFGLAAHAYMFFTFAPSHDSMFYLIATDDEVTLQISNGRFLQPVYWLLRGRIPVPWLVGLLSLLYIAVGGYLIAAALGIERRLPVALLCGILSTDLVVTATAATYLYTLDTYMLALLLACAGVWLWERLPRWGALAAVPLFTCSMALYQAYIDVAIGLALLLLMGHILDGERFSALWKRAVRYGLSLLAGAVLYYAAMELALSLTGVAMSTDYNSLNNLLGSGLSAHLVRIPRAYWDFFWFFMGGRTYNPLPVRLCVAALGLLGTWRWAAVIRARHIRGLELASLLLCTALLPLGLNFIQVLNVGWIHVLMQYSFFLVYAVLLLPFSRELPPRGKTPSVCRGLVVCLCAYVVFSNIVYANGAYFKKQLTYESTSQYAFSVVEAMEADPEYEPGVTPVAIIGSFYDSYLMRQADEYFSMYQQVTGLDREGSITNSSAFAFYCRTVLGHPIALVTDEELLTQIQRAAQPMPLFPKEGFCQMLDGVMVVRLA